MHLVPALWGYQQPVRIRGGGVGEGHYWPDMSNGLLLLWPPAYGQSRDCNDRKVVILTVFLKLVPTSFKFYQFIKIQRSLDAKKFFVIFKDLQVSYPTRTWVTVRSLVSVTADGNDKCYGLSLSRCFQMGRNATKTRIW